MTGKKGHESVVDDSSYQMGVDAFNAGEPLSECPFEDHGYDRRQWVKGWKEAAKEENDSGVQQ